MTDLELYKRELEKMDYTCVIRYYENFISMKIYNNDSIYENHIYCGESYFNLDGSFQEN